jgi:hypothetical protein
VPLVVPVILIGEPLKTLSHSTVKVWAKGLEIIIEKVNGVGSFLYLLKTDVGRKLVISIKELGPFITGTQVRRTALNA